MSDNERDAVAEADSVPAALGASATMEFDAVDATEQAVETRLVSVRGDDGAEPFGVELRLELGAVSAEVVLDGDGVAALSERLAEYEAELV
jgi:hypothetical protein